MDVNQGFDRSGRRGQRLAQAQRLIGQASRDRTTAWYVPLLITTIAAGASFDAFGRAAGLLYAIGLSVAFVALTWQTIRLMPSLLDELYLQQASAPRTLLTLLSAPVRMRGLFLLVAALPVAIALIKVVGFFVLGGLLTVLIVVGAGMAAAWFLERR